MKARVKKLLSEPLLHFLLLGSALFLVFGLTSGDGGEKGVQEQIVVSTGQIEHLATTFTKTWQRPPTPLELKGLVDDHVKEDILAREAVKLGLDRNDTVIRRRLKQKMEFLYEDFNATSPPTEKELAAYFKEHGDDYRLAELISFKHVFLSEERGDQLEADALALLEEMRSKGESVDETQFGDRTLLPSQFEDESWQSLAARFGQPFPAQINALRETGAWQGPIRSGYGLHLVLVTDRQEGRLPELDEVRAVVERDLMAQRREATKQAMLDGLLERYDITIQWPQADTPQITDTPQIANTVARP